ncbi:O-antigen ligase [Caulobacter sp. B11]|uniref:O-antigen ligase family protein n=1 Tax=Caulobacter sp. B11 TaxID=2048899 RepID=UPI001F336264|nr:O-antigen ligase family protein [Caulobacter sp. B11]
MAAAATMSSDASLAGLGLGLAAWLLVGKGGPTGGRVLVGLVAAPFILAPLAVLFGVQTGVWGKLHQWVPASWDARLDIWAFAADKIQAHPIRGWGLDASRTFGLAIPLHTHNAQLQLWLELGAVGAALAGVFFCWLAYGLSRLSVERRGEAAMGAGALVTFLTIGGLSFGVWQEWWLALGALTVIACEMARRGVQRDYVEELALVD